MRTMHLPAIVNTAVSIPMTVPESLGSAMVVNIATVIVWNTFSDSSRTSCTSVQPHQMQLEEKINARWMMSYQHNEQVLKPRTETKCHRDQQQASQTASYNMFKL